MEILCAECGAAATAYRVRWDESNRSVRLCPEHAKPLLELLEKYSRFTPKRRFEDWKMSIEDIDELKIR